MRSTIAVSFLVLGSATAFWRMPCPGRLVDERADPIISPGQVSGHVHTIAGGNGFGFTIDYDQARSSECSSCPIKQDLSNYWTPKLYYHARNGSFISVPQAGDGNGIQGGMTVYYLQRPGPNNDTLQAFPEGFRMLAGNPYKRNYTGDFAAQAISYACLDYNGPAKPETNGFPDYNCPDGLRAQVFFPSCWDGVNLDSPDHQSHVAYPVSGAYNDGPCPSSHPVHLISIFYEVIWQTNLFANDWYGDSQPFIFSMGDATGYGSHGDFVNGWDIDTLQYAVDNCNSLSGNIADCVNEQGNQVFELFSNQESQSCILPDFVDEPVNGVLDQLPGCNPVTYGPDEAQIVSCTPANITDTASRYYTDLTGSMKWAYEGCGLDNVTVRTFQGASESNNNMTVENCVHFCSSQGFSYAGLEYSSQCYCDNTLRSDRAPIPGVMGACLAPCAGDSSQYCGGSATLSTYHNCAGSSTCENANIGSPGNITLTTSTPVSSASSASTSTSSALSASSDSAVAAQRIDMSSCST